MTSSFIFIKFLFSLSGLSSAAIYLVFRHTQTDVQTTLLWFTNIVLGLAVGAFIVYCVWRFIQETIKRRRRWSKEKEATKRLATMLSGIGITLQDGGEEKENNPVSSEE